MSTAQTILVEDREEVSKISQVGMLSRAGTQNPIKRVSGFLMQIVMF